MPTLVQLGFIHYAPKDSEEGIKEYLIVDSMEQIIPYMIKEYGYGYFGDIEEDEDEGCFSFNSEDKYFTPEKIQAGEDLGLVFDGLTDDETYSYITVEGPKIDIIKWLEGDWWEEVSDLYYGATQYNWKIHFEISDDFAESLINANIAKRVENVV